MSLNDIFDRIVRVLKKHDSIIKNNSKETLSPEDNTNLSTVLDNILRDNPELNDAYPKPSPHMQQQDLIEALGELSSFEKTFKYEFDKIDNDHDGCITKDEFNTYISQPIGSGSGREEYIRWQFSTYDVMPRDDKLSFPEIIIVTRIKDAELFAVHNNDTLAEIASAKEQANNDVNAAETLKKQAADDVAAAAAAKKVADDEAKLAATAKTIADEKVALAEVARKKAAENTINNTIAKAEADALAAAEAQRRAEADAVAAAEAQRRAEEEAVAATEAQRRAEEEALVAAEAQRRAEEEAVAIAAVQQRKIDIISDTSKTVTNFVTNMYDVNNRKNLYCHYELSKWDIPTNTAWICIQGWGPISSYMERLYEKRWIKIQSKWDGGLILENTLAEEFDSGNVEGIGTLQVILTDIDFNWIDISGEIPNVVYTPIDKTTMSLTDPITTTVSSLQVAGKNWFYATFSNPVMSSLQTLTHLGITPRVVFNNLPESDNISYDNNGPDPPPNNVVLEVHDIGLGNTLALKNIMGSTQYFIQSKSNISIQLDNIPRPIYDPSNISWKINYTVIGVVDNAIADFFIPNPDDNGRTWKFASKQVSEFIDQRDPTANIGYAFVVTFPEKKGFVDGLFFEHDKPPNAVPLIMTQNKMNTIYFLENTQGSKMYSINEPTNARVEIYKAN